MPHNIEWAETRMKGWHIRDEHGALKKYLMYANTLSGFAETVGSDNVIVEGYAQISVRGGSKRWRTVNMLD